LGVFFKKNPSFSLPSFAQLGLKAGRSDSAQVALSQRSQIHLRIFCSLGISVPLSDVIIAADCIDHGLVLIESDRHFATIAAHLPLKRYAIE